ncbi:hypothetical protein STAS_15835 [Striga asiatica]|uniref:Heparan-alpha-glucosaminide N-acetyltransferase catalytic domain-containing protein n=1 Tax=Striga asiatica TaxID=4170 RepID=A0A5A7Q2Z4_STRAF|nr:hypothetical protein STAS_15835 [Striga asiatica]
MLSLLCTKPIINLHHLLQPTRARAVLGHRLRHLLVLYPLTFSVALLLRLVTLCYLFFRFQFDDLTLCCCGDTTPSFPMPFFLFMVGVSVALVYKNTACRAAASRKAIHRAAKLIVIGLFLQGGFFHGLNNLTYGVDVEHIRWMGILQRIGAAYLVAAMCEIWLRNDEKVRSGSSLIKKYQWHWIMVLLLTSVYLLLLYAVYVPDWEYHIPHDTSSEAKINMVKCGVRGDTGPACNSAGMIDRMILGVNHLYRKPIYSRTQQCSINSPDYGPLPPDAPSWCRAPFEPEGCLSTVMAVVTCLIGLQYGHIIIHFKVDVYGYRRFTMVLEWMGKHALVIYILVACNVLPLILQGFYWRNPGNNLLTAIGIGKKSH